MPDSTGEVIDLAAMRARHLHAERMLHAKPAAGTMDVGWTLTLEDITLPAHADRAALLSVLTATRRALLAQSLARTYGDDPCWCGDEARNPPVTPDHIAECRQATAALALCTDAPGPEGERQ